MSPGTEKKRALLVGLGNPGDRYRDTRHNIGFLIVDRFVEQHRFARQKPTSLTEIYRGNFAEREIWASKPLTFMNLSGQAVSWMARQHKIDPVDTIILLDDFALPLGRMRLRATGSPGGHNGLKSIQADLGTQAYPRLRIGIGPVPERWDPADFVLGRFKPAERQTLDEVMARACDCLDVWLSQGIEPAMNRFNATSQESKDS